MEENEVLEQEAEVTDEDLDVFDEDWGDDSGSEEDFDLSDDGDEPADEAGEETDGETEEPGNENEEGHQLFKINYLGNEEELTLEQMTEYAQKGRDYDHVRQERDNLRAEREKSKGSENQLAFLKDLADRAGVTVDEQIEKTRALWLMNDEYDKGNEITEDEALKRVRESKPAKAEDSSGNDIPDWFNPAVSRFLEKYPGTKYEDIPQEVWDATFKSGGDLLGSYQAWEIRQLKEEKAKQQKETQNETNYKRSTGSLKSAGASKSRDAFDEGWYSDD